MSDYSGYDIKQLWQMVVAAKQGLQPSYDQVAALNKAHQMLTGHAQSLEAARDQLAAKWPPEANAAAAAYLTELDRLIAAAKDTALSCAINVFHINTVSDAIIHAYETLGPLHDEYVRNEGVLTQYDADVSAFGEGASLVPGSSTITKGAAKLFTSPPVEGGRQNELTQHARQEMISLSEAAYDGANYIKPPAPYEPPIVGSSYDEPSFSLPGGGSTNGSSGTAILPPTIDSATYKRYERDGAAPNHTGHMTGQLSTGGSGPNLAEHTPIPVQPTQSPIPSIGLGPAAGRLSRVDGPFTLLPGGTPGIGSIPIGIRTPAAKPFGTLGAPRGSVIGTVPGNTDVARATPLRVSPPGGIIGQQVGPGGRGGVRASAIGSKIADRNGAWTAGAQTHGRRSGKPRSNEQEWDPDNPWDVDEGVDPVILPDAPPGRVDPGPGIIGLDR